MTGGLFASSPGSDILALLMKQYFRWSFSEARLVMFSAVQETVDGGVDEPKLNIKIGGAFVSTNDTNKGLQLGASGTWVSNSAVAISTTNYVINRNTALEINLTAGGSNGLSANLTVSCHFVLVW